MTDSGVFSLVPTLVRSLSEGAKDGWGLGLDATTILAALLFVTLLLTAYKIYFRPTFAKTRNSFNRKSAAFEAKRRKLFPSPYPNGWYGLCDLSELDDGRIKSVHCLGQDLVAFRGESGDVGVLDAFCPHLGAHLGQGGTVIGDTIQCPFHQWRFNANGEVTHIPYLASSSKQPQEATVCAKDPAVPASCRTKSWTARVWGGFVFVWFDAEGRAPTYEMEYPEEIDTGSWYYGGTTKMEFDQHVSEMAENSADYHHFSTLHKPLPIPLLGRFLTVDHRVQLIPSKDADRKHVLYFDDNASIFWRSHQLLPRSTMHVTFEGPAIVHFRMDLAPLGEVFVCKTILPIGPFHQYTEDRWWASNTVPRFLGHILAYIAKNALEQDRQVWENKVYQKRPMLVKGDGPFPTFRRWYRQFYSEHSKDLAQSFLDW